MNEILKFLFTSRTPEVPEVLIYRHFDFTIETRGYDTIDVLEFLKKQGFIVIENQLVRLTKKGVQFLTNPE